MLLTNAQFLILRKAFANGSSGNINFSKTQLHKIGQSGGLLDRILQTLLKNGLPLMKKILPLLSKSVLIPFELIAASATDAAVHEKMFGLGTTTSVISNEEMNDIMKTVKSLEESVLLIKDISETIQNEVKEQGGFLGMLLGTLGASLLGNSLARKATTRVGEGTISSGRYFQCQLIF